MSNLEVRAFTKIEQQVMHMLKLQNEANCAVNPQWLDADCDWRLAAVLELAELLDHSPWKWWKSHKGMTPEVLKAMQMEAVDVFHFLLSSEIQVVHNSGECFCPLHAQDIAEYWNTADRLSTTPRLYALGNYNQENVELVVKNIIADLLLCNSLEHKFIRLLALLGMSFDDLYIQYLGKNALNNFRQSRGYNSGWYQKIWFGEEDNVTLQRILEDCRVEEIEVTVEAITARLAHYYSLVLKDQEFE